MKANELRIGNYVFTQSDKLVKQKEGERTQLYQVQNVNLQSALKFDPIPITEEWLFNFELSSYKDVKIKDCGFICMEGNNIYIMGHDNPTFGSMFQKNIKYVHELQNLYFALTGEELTIKNNNFKKKINMLTEVNTAQKYLIEKFGSAEAVPVGIHAVPFETSKGNAFLKVEITAQRGMCGFDLFKDEALTQDWHKD